MKPLSEGLSLKGSASFTVTPEQIEAALMQVSTIFAKPFEVSLLKRFTVRADGALVDEASIAAAR